MSDAWNYVPLQMGDERSSFLSEDWVKAYNMVGVTGAAEQEVVTVFPKKIKHHQETLLSNKLWY